MYDRTLPPAAARAVRPPATGRASVQSIAWSYFFLLPSIVPFLVFTALPLLQSIVMSVQNVQVRGPSAFVGLSNFANVVENPIFWKGVANSAIYTAFVVPIWLVIALFLSALVFSLPLRLHGPVKGAFYLPGVVSGVVISLIWSFVFHPQSGLLNALMDVLGLPHQYWLGHPKTALGSLIFMSLAGGGGGSIVLFTASMAAIPYDLHEVAMVDGATPITRFFRITLPLLKPIILFMLITGTIGSFQIFEPVLILTAGGPNYATTTVVFQIYQYAFQYFKFGIASAQALLLAVVIMIISVIQFRLLASDVSY
ncbi:MAG: carbohydrate ABC transporter permease [Anaerolineae bacterium]|jgi:multiple sugar transport system permease protein